MAPALGFTTETAVGWNERKSEAHRPPRSGDILGGKNTASVDGKKCKKEERRGHETVKPCENGGRDKNVCTSPAVSEEGRRKTFGIDFRLL